MEYAGIMFILCQIHVEINRSPLEVWGSEQGAGLGMENLGFCLGSATNTIQLSWPQFSS